MIRPFAVFLAIAISAPLPAQTGDAPPVNVSELLAALRQLRDTNEKTMIARRSDAITRVMAAAASGEKAVAFWKDAIKAVQFEGAKHEGSQIRDWREGDGEALNDKLCQNAVRLHLYWLGMTLKHAAGTETKVLLPNVIEFVKQVQADQEAIEQFSDQLQKSRERENKSAAARKNVQEDSIVRRVHDQIIRQSVGESPVARWMRIEEIVGGGGGGKGRKPGAPGASWEYTPGNVNGIFNAIILPEFRLTKDPRLLDYWDMVLKKETERMADHTLDVEQREWATERRPSLLWQRAQDVLLLGQRNRAIGEMFNIVKTFPAHPSAAAWIEHLQSILVPTADLEPAPAAASTGAPGAVPAPAAVPPATASPSGTPVPPR